MEEQLREQALRMIGQGLSVTNVAQQLGKSRQWVYKWIDRYSPGKSDWASSRSNAPRSPANKTSQSIESAIIKVRRTLEVDPYKESGAYPIIHELRRQGITPPSVATINRILRKHGLTNSKRVYEKSGIDYPDEPSHMQLMDLIGPRHLRGGNRFYLLNIISNDTRHAGVYPILSKGAEGITKGVISFWKSYSVPEYLQMDNELSFKGSNRHPRGLGLLMRTALSLNVTPRFIPVGEPWRNGVIERFNQKVEKTLLTQPHKDFDDLMRHSEQFMEVHNSEHHYSTMNHKTPLQMDLEKFGSIHPLSPHYEVSERPKINPNNLNEIIFIRLVRSDGLINVLNTQVEVIPELIHTYVEAKICLNDHCLEIRQDGMIKQIKQFKMPVI